MIIKDPFNAKLRGLQTNEKNMRIAEAGPN